MNILYVNPGRIAAGLDSIIKGPPLALLSIAAMAPDHGAELFDFKVDTFHDDAFRRRLNHFDVVAITSLTPQIPSAYEVAEMAKDAGCHTILGGYQPTLVPEEVAAHPAVDFAVRGEGEHTFRDIVDYLDGNKNHVALKEIPGISYVPPDTDGGTVVHNADRQLEQNLDIFPFPRRDLLAGKKYHYFGATIEAMETSRGCPHNCNFCCIHKMWKDPRGQAANARAGYRTKSIRRIMQELYELDWSKFFTFFCEDNFTMIPRRAEAICDWIIRSGLPSKLHFSCQSRVDTIVRYPHLVDKMAEAGFRQVFLGIESVHQQTLDAIGKRTSVEQAKRAVQMLHDRGISIFGSIIIGFPGETRRMVRENLLFAGELDLDQVQFTSITAFPGTPYFDEVTEKGWVATKDWRRYNLMQTMMGTDDLSASEIYALVAEAYATHYLNARWPLGKLFQYVTKRRFRWFLPLLPKFMREFVLSGREMFRTQGIHMGIVSDETRAIRKSHRRRDKAEARRRYKRYKALKKQLEALEVPLVTGTPEQPPEVPVTPALESPAE